MFLSWFRSEQPAHRPRRWYGDFDALEGRRRSPKFGPRVLEALEGRALMSSGMHMHDFHPHHHAQTVFQQTNLVSDVTNLATVTDPSLVNPWGLAASPTGGPWWINENHTGFSTVYNVSGTTPANPLRVTIPPPTETPGATAAPTGIVFNVFNNTNTSDFLINGKPALFIFDTEDGTISAWNSTLVTTPGSPGSPGTSTAMLEVDNFSNGAVYKGLAMGTAGGANYLYATNFHDGTIDVFDKNFAPKHLLPRPVHRPEPPARFRPLRDREHQQWAPLRDLRQAGCRQAR